MINTIAILCVSFANAKSVREKKKLNKSPELG